MRGKRAKQLRKVGHLVYIKTVAPARQMIINDESIADIDKVTKLDMLMTPRQVYRMIKRQYKRHARG